METGRLSIDAYGILLALGVSARGTCPRAKVGAVLMKDRRIISTGYNGAPSAMMDCITHGCLMHKGPQDERERCINTIHAEINALIRSHEQGDTIYTTHKPCLNCSKAIFSHNKDMRVVYLNDYSDEARDLWISVHGVHTQMEQIMISDFSDIQKWLTSMSEGIK